MVHLYVEMGESTHVGCSVDNFFGLNSLTLANWFWVVLLVVHWNEQFWICWRAFYIVSLCQNVKVTRSLVSNSFNIPLLAVVHSIRVRHTSSRLTENEREREIVSSVVCSKLPLSETTQGSFFFLFFFFSIFIYK